MKRLPVTIVILGLLPGCAAIQVPHRSPSPGCQAGRPIGLIEIMDDTSGIFDAVTDSARVVMQPARAGILRLKLSLAVVDFPQAIDDIADIASVHNGYITDSDTGYLGLCIPTGNLKAVLASIGALGDIIDLAFAGADNSAEDVRQPGEMISTGDIIFNLLAGGSRVAASGKMKDGAPRLFAAIREGLKLDPGKFYLTAIDINLLAVKPKKTGVGDYMRFFVHGIGDILKR